MDSYFESLCDQNEREEMEAEFEARHGISYSDYLEDLKTQYVESFEER